MIKGDACKEGVLEWVPKEKVTSLPIWEGDKIFFRLLKEERPYFSLKLVYEGDTLKQAVLDGKALCRLNGVASGHRGISGPSASWIKAFISRVQHLSLW